MKMTTDSSAKAGTDAEGHAGRAAERGVHEHAAGRGHGGPHDAAHDHGAHGHGAHDHGAHGHDGYGHDGHGHDGHGHDGHGHDGHGGHHDHTHGASESRIGLAALLTGAFMVAEVAGSLVSGSLALLADAGHMLTDFASLALAWYGFRIARRPADWRRTYGYDRFTVLVAFGNGLALFAIAGWIVIEAWHRLNSPTPVLGGIMLWVALAGLAVNVAAFWLLMGANRDNLNVRAALLHVMGDLLGSVAAIVAAVVIIATGWMPIDPLLSVLVAFIILRSAWHVVRESGHILLEGSPAGVDSRQIADDLNAHFPEISDVHHVHAWSITQERAVVTMHVRTAATSAPEQLSARIKERLVQRFGIRHATIELEFQSCADNVGKAGADVCGA